jgi:hypothetical protein
MNDKQLTEAFIQEHARVPHNGDCWDTKSPVSGYVTNVHSFHNGEWIDMALEPITLTVEQAEALMLWSEALTTPPSAARYGPKFEAAFEVAQDVAKHLRGEETSNE